MELDYHYSKLGNGVRSLIVPIEGTESVTVLVLVKTGSRNEMDKQLGISHVVEHMLFKGTKKYPTALSLAEAVDGLGAIHNAFTGKEYTGYYITSAGRHLVKSMEILAEMIRAPLLPTDDLEREKGVIIQEIKMYEDHPMERVGEEFENLVFAGSKMGRLIIGSEKTVQGVTVEDLRSYMSRWYRGENVLVIVAGKVGSEVEVEKLIEAGFGGLAQGKLDGYVEGIKYGEERKFYLSKKTEQAHLVMGVPTFGMQDKRRYPMSVARVVLGGNMSSRLFNEVREKRGLAYYVGASLETAFDGGYLAVKAGVKLDKLGEAIKVIKFEMLRLAETLTQKEVDQAKEYLLGKLPLGLEGSMDIARFVGARALIIDELRQPSEMQKAIERVSLAEVKQVVGELVVEKEIRECVVGR